MDHMLNQIDELMSEKVEDLAGATIDFYRWCLVRYAGWTRERCLDPAAATKKDILEWLNSGSWSQSTKHNAVCALRHFYRRYYTIEPLEEISIRRPRPRLQRTLYTSEVEQLLSSLDTHQEKGARDLSILTLMIDTGMRANELCSLHVEHVDPAMRTVDLRIKGGDWHRSVFGKYAVSCLYAWLQVRPIHAGTGVPFLYVGIGGSTPGQKMTVTGLRATFYKLAASAGIPRFSPHALRRTFATLSTRFGVPGRLVQANGGWQTPEMVQRYTLAIRAEDFTIFPTDRIMGIDDDTRSGRDPNGRSD
jgi:site-specific recombinase XerD